MQITLSKNKVTIKLVILKEKEVQAPNTVE